ncbi:UNVERIFIED_CONTAM: hypothetical protein Sindi_2634000 [Sesamum indicum]
MDHSMDHIRVISTNVHQIATCEQATVQHMAPENPAPQHSLPFTYHSQRRSLNRSSSSIAQRDTQSVDIAGPPNGHTSQNLSPDCYVPELPQQDYCVPKPSQQDDWFQSTPYMPIYIEGYSTPVDLDLNLGITQTYAQEHNISPIQFSILSAYRHPIQSNSTTSSSRLHIPTDDGDQEQNEPTEPVVQQRRRIPQRQWQCRTCGTRGHY